MDYMNDSFTYTAQHTHNQPVLYQPVTYFTFRPHQSQAVDDFYSSYGHNEYTDFMQYHEDYEELGAVSTRPRLTREQVEVLEAQFQANHKPNSILKRHLAVQTRLSPARVANWFQNRRAKAKQQRKQEEFENAQSHGHTDGPEAEVSIKTDQPEFDDDADSCTIFSQHDSHVVAPKAETPEHPRGMDQQRSKEAGWASVQRAVRAGREALELREMHQLTQMQTSASNDLPQQPHQMPIPTSVTSSQQYGATLSQWQTRQPLMDPWSPTHQFQDTSFNFGFDPQDASSLCKEESRGQVASHEFTLESGVVAQQPWQEAVPPTDLLNDHMEAQFLGSPDIPVPQYPESRRGSAADSLTANFGTFALASESPQMLANPVPMTEPLRRPEGYLNIAARRKGPRPATLTPEALWNRSYGAMTSVSPTARSGMTPSAHTIRHVKSTGHGLNGARPGGIRKASSAQRSPINVSTFAEADSLHRLIAQQATAAAHAHAVAMSNAESATSVATPGLVSNAQTHPEEGPGFLAQHLASRYQLPNTQHLTLNTASPPTTPFSAEFAHNQQHLMMPPASAPLQHAHFLEYTPPYSAGPLTSSSWSDAPQTSPDFPTFPPVTYVPTLNQAKKMDSPQSYFQPFVLQSDTRSDLNQMSSTLQQKKTEFLIQEFPNQKEEHAQIAQQLVPTRPKNYVFTNTAASDYDQA